MSNIESESYKEALEKIATMPTSRSPTSALAHQHKKTHTFKHGQMYIALEMNRFSFMPGDTVRGAVLLQQQAPLVAHDLILTFKGVEAVNFRYFKDVNIPKCSAPAQKTV